VHIMRGLPMQLSGGTMQRLASRDGRVCQTRKARYSIGIYAQKYEEDMFGCLVDLWQGNLDVGVIDQQEDFVPDAGEKDDMALDLGGHVLGSIPDDHMSTKTVSGMPPLDMSKTVARHAAERGLKAGNLCLHTRVMRSLSGGNQQQQIMAAQCLSSSCANTGHMLRWTPGLKHHGISDSHMVQFLRMRSGCRRHYR